MTEPVMAHKIGPATVEIVWKKEGKSKNGKNYTAFSLLLAPFKGDGVEISDEDKVWVSCGFKKPFVNKGDYVNVVYETAGDKGQFKNVIDISYVKADTTE